MKFCGSILKHKLMVFVFIVFYEHLEALQKNSRYDYWKLVSLNRTILENTMEMKLKVSAYSITLCAMYSSATKTANAFCFQSGFCQAFYIEPCRVLFNVESEEDILSCYSNIDFEALQSIYRKASYHKYLGYYWLTTVKLTWWENNKKCQEDGGQLASLENFPNQKELDESGILPNNQEDRFIGVIRNGTGAEFTWLTGTILETTSFMWGPGEPNNPDFETICGTLWSTGIAEEICDLQLLSICHIPLA